MKKDNLHNNPHLDNPHLDNLHLDNLHLNNLHLKKNAYILIFTITILSLITILTHQLIKLVYVILIECLFEVCFWSIYFSFAQ